MPKFKKIEEEFAKLESLTEQILAWAQDQLPISIERVRVLYKQREESLQQLYRLIFENSKKWNIEQINVWKRKADIIQEADQKIVELLNLKIAQTKEELLAKERQKQMFQKYREQNYG